MRWFSLWIARSASSLLTTLDVAVITMFRRLCVFLWVLIGGSTEIVEEEHNESRLYQFWLFVASCFEYLHYNQTINTTYFAAVKCFYHVNFKVVDFILRYTAK